MSVINRLPKAHPFLLVAIGGLVGYLLTDYQRSTTIALLQLQLKQQTDPAKHRLLPELGTGANIARPQVRSVHPSANPAVSLSEDQKRILRDHSRAEERVARWLQTETAEYDRLFSELGMSKESAADFIHSRAGLLRFAIAAGDPTLRLLEARRSYDKSLKDTLSPEQYAKYRDYEESKPAARELEAFREYSQGVKGLTLEPQYSKTIAQLLKDSNVSTGSTWDGPYDPVPSPRIGDDAVEQQKRDFDTLTTSVATLNEGLVSSDLPDIYKSSLRQYYSNILKDRKEFLTFTTRPHEEQMAIMEEIAAKQRAEAERNARGGR